jgi:large subunit ribosomal protein L15
MMKEHELKPPVGSTKPRKRVGRGNGSGHGTYSGRGGKGQTARSGGKIPAWFEGGQMPLQRRVPKRGFTNPFRVVNQIVNLAQLDSREGDEFTVARMVELGLVDAQGGPVKVLAKGTISRAVTVEADAFSAGARDAIQAAGGTIRTRSGEE